MRVVTQEDAARLVPGISETGAVFDSLDMRRWDLSECRFDDCTFVACDLRDTRLNGAVFAGCSFERCWIDGTDLFGAVFRACKLMAADFTRGARVVGTSFVDSNLDYALFRGVNLTGIDFEGCSMREVDLSLSDLSGAALTNCDLDGAEWREAVARDTDIRGSHLRGLDPRCAPSGLIVTSLQAVELVEAIGVRVVDPAD